MSIGKKLILIGQNPTTWVLLSVITNRDFINASLIAENGRGKILMYVLVWQKYFKKVGVQYVVTTAYNIYGSWAESKLNPFLYFYTIFITN